MEYRILKIGSSYYVEYRKGWWRSWTRETFYILYDKPIKVTKYGGFFLDIGYQATEHGYHTDRCNSRADAEERLRVLKNRDRAKRKPREKTGREVVHKE